jgi:hypothetical protein
MQWVATASQPVVDKSPHHRALHSFHVASEFSGLEENFMRFMRNMAGLLLAALPALPCGHWPPAAMH